MDAPKKASSNGCMNLLVDKLGNGAVGLLIGLILFLPTCWLSMEFWLYIFFDVLKKTHNINTDALLSIIIYYPVTMVVSGLSGTLGGYIGSRISRGKRGAIVGALVGSIIGGICTVVLFTYSLVKGWVK